MATSKTNWEKSQSYIEERLNRKVHLKMSEDLNGTDQEFIQLIKEAGWKSTPYRCDNVTTRQFYTHTDDMIAVKCRARRRWKHLEMVTANYNSTY